MCISDDSDGNSITILSAYKVSDNRIKIIVQKKKGIAAARNTGIKAFKAKNVTICWQQKDSDMIITFDLLQTWYGHHIYSEEIKKIKERD